MILTGFCLLFAACSGSPRSDEAAEDVNAKRVTEVDKDAPRAGGKLTVALTGVDSLDPARANEASTGVRVVLDMVYDGLVRWDSLAKAITPGVAKAWNVSDDGLTWTFEISANAQFSNARPVTSADVKFSLERLAARGSSAISAVQLSSLKGYTDFMARKADVIGGLNASDPAKLVMTLDAPFGPMLELLASPAFGVVAKEAVDATGAMTGVISSGPFALASQSADKLEFARSTRSRALLEGVTVILAKDTEASFTAFKDGTVQVATMAPEQQVDTTTTTVRSTNGGSYFYGMNVTAPALNDPAIRAAIVKAINRDDIRAKFFAQGELANGLIPPGVDGYRDDACAAACAFDAAAATQMVTTALAGKPATTIHVDYYADAAGKEAEIAKAIAASLTAAGLPAQPRSHTFEEYNTFVATGAAELFRFGWVGTYLSADAYLTPLFGSATIDNVFGVKDAESDKLIASARSVSEPSARATKYVALEDRVLSLASVVPIARYKSAYAVAGVVRGVTADAEGVFDIERVWLAQ